MFDSYWISPRGTVHIVPTTHIGFILNNLGIFGLTNSDIVNIESKYAEQVIDEGNARNEIMTNILQQGWVRIRYDNIKEWIIQVWTLSKKIKNNIYVWTCSMIEGTLKGVKVFLQSQIYLINLGDGNSKLIVSFDDIRSGILLEY